MKKQRRGLNRHNMLQDEKKEEKNLYLCMIHKKLTLKKKKNILPGLEPTSMKIDES